MLISVQFVICAFLLVQLFRESLIYTYVHVNPHGIVKITF